MTQSNRSVLGEPKVVNVGISLFADALEKQSASVAHVAWTPPVELEEDLQQILDDLL